MGASIYQKDSPIYVGLFFCVYFWRIMSNFKTYCCKLEENILLFLLDILNFKVKGMWPKDDEYRYMRRW